MKRMVLSLVFLLSVASFAGSMWMENLNRGLVAVKKGSGYYLSWRHLGNEDYGTGYNIYCGSTKVNSTPITGATVYTHNTSSACTYTVRAVVSGMEQAASDAAIVMNNTQGNNAGYFDISIQKPATGSRNNGTYMPNDGSVGDLNGDGVYEVVLKWDPSNSQDNSNGGVTDNVYLDAYTLTGTRLWRIDLGQNIRAGAHYTQFLVYDFDGDGKAEVMVKTAPGTKDGTGTNIKMGPAANAEHNRSYANSSGYILSGPEYLTVFEGETGKELATADYWPERGNVGDWGKPFKTDTYGNRVDRFNAAVAYVDGERPSAMFGRGYYGRLTWAAWDWRDGKLTRRWTFDSGTTDKNGYAGQGNHQVSVADADNDGYHEIITGASVIDHDGKGKHKSGRGHGDALHVAHMKKNSATPQIFQPHEESPYGISLREASNGNQLFALGASGDTGRGCIAELEAGYGFTAWGTDGLYNINGEKVGNSPGIGTNFLIWWDGELTREGLDGRGAMSVKKWSIKNNRATTLLTTDGCTSHNTTKANPVLSGDILGDWREEIILSTSDGTKLRVFTTTMPTEYRLPTLVHDPVYRVALSWQNSAYNQPPHPGYYIASDMNFPVSKLDIKIVGENANKAPAASITAPANNKMFMPGEAIEIAATATDPDGSVAKVEFYNGTSKLGEKTGTPYTFSWTTAPEGVHAITVKAIDDKGAATTSAAVNVAVAAHIGSGRLIEDLYLFNPTGKANWSIQNSVAAGDSVNGDRANIWSSLPPVVTGAEYIRTAIDPKDATTKEQARFKTKAAVTVFVLLDSRVIEPTNGDAPRPLPAWLEGWIRAEGEANASNNVKYYVYQKDFAKGAAVTLGTNVTTQTVINYVVAVKESGSLSIVKPQYFMPSQAAPHYYSLKGEPLGTVKPKNAGVYIIKQGSSVRKIMVR